VSEKTEKPECAPGKARRIAIEVVVILLGTIAAALVSHVVRVAYVIPALCAAPLVPFYVWNGKNGRLVENVFLSLVWVAALGVTMTAACAHVWPAHRRPETFSYLIGAPDYIVEMRRWLETGVGVESRPSQFIPVHITHFMMVVVLSGLTGGVGGLLGGTVLMNYMGAYAGTVLADASNPVPTAVMVWPIWSLIRIVGFICAATAASEVFYAWAFRRPIRRVAARTLFAIGLSLVVLDIIIKASLAPTWRVWLLHAFSS